MTPLLFDVPAGTPSSRCRGCDRVVYFIMTNAGKSMPVDCDVDGGHAPSSPGSGAQHSGKGISHFANCPAAAQFRRPR